MTRAVVAATMIALCAVVSPAREATAPSVVVIGIDGMDPQLLTGFMQRGLMPHFTELEREGSFHTLGTSIPPQSPVAWSNFITGMDPGGHGVFDFIHRNPDDYLPTFSAAAVTPPGKTISIGPWVIPLSPGKTTLLRRGDAFWQVLGKHDIPYNVFRVPANFPPAPGPDRSLSGMGTPDILGSYGTFSYYTDDDLYDGIDISGGELHKVTLQESHFDAALPGPVNTLRRDLPQMTVPFTVDVDTTARAVVIAIANQSFVVNAGEWSPWIRVSYPVLGVFKRVTAIARFYVREVTPRVHLYATPVNIDPSSPALPLSTPAGYAARVRDRIGYFYTQGMPEDTKALEYGMLDDREFIGQTENVLGERSRMLDLVLDDYRGGFLFFYVSTIDQSCHALWRTTDREHPAHTDDKFAGRFEELYVRMDEFLGRVRARIPGDATLIVMSDHGFAPYRYKVNLNTWLMENGYLQLIKPDEIGKHTLLENIFWRRTRAYALGINALYVNQQGRESRGLVRDGADKDAVLDEITSKLLAWRDPATGDSVVTAVFRTSEVFHGDALANAPDLVIGYNRGYRGSDENALGAVAARVIVPNVGKWSGDHCMDPAKVPGILLSNRKIAANAPQLIDLPVTILNLYGIPAPAQMRGRDVFHP